MARVDLRNAHIYLRDGFGGAAAINDASISAGNTTLEIGSVASLTNSTNIVPVGARFEIAGVDETYTVTAQNANEQQQVVADATSGNFTLTFDGQTTGNILYNADAAAVQSALEALSNVAVGDVVVTSPTASTWVVEFRGQYLGEGVPEMTATDVDLAGGGDTVAVTTLHPGATTWELTFTPALVVSDLPADTDVITFLPQQVEVKVGDGNLGWTESREVEYLLDRGLLDTVREGDEQPVEVKLDLTWEHVRTGTSEAITPNDALKGIGGASGWVSSSQDQCEVYAVDVVVEYIPPCGGSETETIVFPDFRYESIEFSFKDAAISVTGRSNAVEPDVTRS
jgi:hypothetical protein